MRTPFEKFEVTMRFFTRYFTVGILDEADRLFNIEDSDDVTAWRVDTRRFIEAAIREKLEREGQPQGETKPVEPRDPAAK